MNKQLLGFFDFVKDKKITVVGIGVSNTPLIKLLVAKGALVTACDRMSGTELGTVVEELEGLGVKLCLGPDYLEQIQADILFKTPGMRFDLPQLLAAEQNGTKITSEMEVFFQVCPCKIIAVTGSDGKSTTTTLIAELLRASGQTVHLGGNLGKPLLPEVESMKPNHIAVVELSSFQLHTMEKSPHIAVVTNVTPNHLDMHKSMEEYVAAKTNIFRFQNSCDLLVLNADNETTASFAVQAKGKVRTFSSMDTTADFYLDTNDDLCYNDEEVAKKLLSKEDILLPGRHNKENYMAAIAAAFEWLSPSIIHQVASSFKGLNHRLELVRELDEVRYYNDSIASSPTRTIACLRSFTEKLIIIAGGYDKKIPFDVLGPVVLEQVKILILTGATAQKIRSAVEKAPGYKESGLIIRMCDSMSDAVSTARALARVGDQVILSPACASFDTYKNFEVRGNHFKTLVNALS